MSEAIRIATANTYAGQMLDHSDGLKPFAQTNVDILLLQEVLGLDTGQVEDTLLAGNYALANFDRETGLAIAIRPDSGITTWLRSERVETIQPIGRLGKFATSHHIPAAGRLRARGLISAQLLTASGNTITVATTHPIVFIRGRARARQLQAIGTLLEGSQYADQALVLGADMNHYPRPGKADLALRQASQLREVPLAVPTWQIRGSKHEWLARFGSMATGHGLDSFDAQLDSMLYRGTNLELLSASVADINSDHRAIIGTFALSKCF